LIEATLKDHLKEKYRIQEEHKTSDRFLLKPELWNFPVEGGDLISDSESYVSVQ
jgi:hypothetical protein